jgi:hypothetical protein
MEYGFPPKRLTLRDYGVGELRSALFTKAGRQLVVMEERVAALQARFDIFTTISFSIIALILALVLGTASRVLLVKVAGAQLAALTLAVAVFAALVALFSYIDRWSTRALFERYGQVIGLRLGTLQTIMHSWRYVSIVVFAATALVIATILYVKTDHIDSSYVTHAELLRMQKDIQSKMQGAAPAAGGTARRSDGA